MNDNDRVANDSHEVSNISNNETNETTEHEQARDDERPSQTTEVTEPVHTQTDLPPTSSAMWQGSRLQRHNEPPIVLHTATDSVVARLDLSLN